MAKYIANQIVHAPTTNPNNTAKAVVVAGGLSGTGLNIYLVSSKEPGSASAIQQLVTEALVGSLV